MNIWEIDERIYELLDPDTGEISDYEAFCKLNMEREQKIENAALMMKNKLAEAKAIKTEIEVLTKRKRQAERTAERLKWYINQALNGQKFETSRCSVGYRKSKSVGIDAEFIAWAKFNRPELLIEQMPDIDRDELKRLLNEGMECPYARIEEKQNIQIK